MSNFLQAASELLIRYGKPMHYATIASTAIELGLLKSESKAPEIAMSSALSKEVNLNPKSFLKKHRDGVYSVIFGEYLGSYLLKKNGIGNRLVVLKNKFDLKDEKQVIKRAIFILRTFVSMMKGKKEIILSNNEEEFLIDFTSSANIKNQMDVYVGNQSSLRQPFTKKVSLEKEICIALELLRDKLQLKDIYDTLDFCISLLEFLYKFKKGDTIDFFILGKKFTLLKLCNITQYEGRCGYKNF